MDFKALFNTLTLTSAIILAGCSAGLDETEENNAMSTFSAGKMSVYTAQDQDDALWAIPNKADFVFKTCLKDRAYGKSIIGQSFEVTGDNVTETVTSDNQGCIFWNDFVRYNFLAPEHDITVKRTITGLGDFGGEYTVSFNVNPWTKKVIDGTVNVKNKYASKALSANQKTLTVGKVSLVKLEEQHFANSAVISTRISFSPLYRRFTKTGSPTAGKYFKKGTFNVTAIIFEEKLDGSITPISTPETYEATVNKNGKLENRVNLNLFKAPSADDGNTVLKLGLRVVPAESNAPKYLTAVEGFVALTTDLRIKDASFDQTTDLPEVAFSAAFEKSSGDNKFGFNIKEPRISFDGYTDEHNGTAAIKTMRTKVESCMINSISRSKVNELEFRVNILDQDKNVIFTSAPKKANTSGCVKTFFEEDYNLNVSRDTNYLKRYIQIVGLEGTYEGISKDRLFYINPWETNRYSHTVSGELPPSYNNVQDSKLYTQKFSIMYVGNEDGKYRLNRHMDMSFVKTFKTEFTPKINRGFKHSGEKGFDRIYSGKLKMRLMVLAPKKDALTKNLDNLLSASKRRTATINAEELGNYKFITGAEKVVTIVDGKVADFINLKFNTNNVKYISTRTYVVVELSSMDEDNAVKPMILTIPAMLASTRYNSDTMTQETIKNVEVKELTVNNKLNAYFANIKKIELDNAPKSLWKVNSYDLFEQVLADDENLKNFKGLKNVTYMGWTKSKNFYDISKKKRMQLLSREEFDFIMNLNKGETDKTTQHISPKSWLFPDKGMMKDLVKKVCYLFYTGKNGKRDIWGNYKSDEHRCRTNPEEYIGIKGAKYVLNITKQPTQNSGSAQRSISIATRNDSRVNKSFSEYWGWRADWGVKLDTFGLEAIGLKSGGGVGVSYGESWSNGKSLGESISLGESQRLDVEETVLEFEAKTRACVLLKGKKTKQGIRLCEGEDKIETIKEHWYLINEPWRRRSFVADPGAQNEMRIFKLVRGKVKFAQFKNLIEASNNQLFANPIEARTGISQYLTGLFDTESGEVPHLTDDSFPGLIE